MLTDTQRALLYLIANKLNIYVGFILFFLGVIGGLCNLLVFAKWRTIKENSCVIYILMGSAASIIELINIIFIQIMSLAFAIDLSTISSFYCKIRVTLVQYPSMVALASYILSSFNRWATTSQSASMRQLSHSARFAVVLCTFTNVFWLLHSIPIIILTELTRTATGSIVCIITSPQLIRYRDMFFQPFFYCIFPLSLLAYFGLSTVHRLRVIHRSIAPVCIISGRQPRRRFDIQLTRVILFQILVCMLSTLMFAGQAVYTAITQPWMIKTPDILAIEYMYRTVALLLFYFNYVFPFYCTFATSSIFRRHLYNILLSLVTRARTLCFPTLDRRV